MEQTYSLKINAFDLLQKYKKETNEMKGLFKSGAIKNHTFLFLGYAIVLNVCSMRPACRRNNLMGFAIWY